MFSQNVVLGSKTPSLVVLKNGHVIWKTVTLNSTLMNQNVFNYKVAGY
jgi:hypothetical protein